DVTAVPRPAADRAPAYGIEGEVVDGNDVGAVQEAVARLAARARGGDGPALLEAQTYRHFGHSRADPATYRPAEEVERWLKHDPLDLARGRLVEMGVSEAVLSEADERATTVVQRAVEAAKAAPPPDPDQALTDVWADGGAAWRT
ncbi:thiamine pyrophosphate-dependent enzyme, partial [Streptomyces chartreusis]|uniref:thiamine pyrophosphate-dependent enzyme n=1 Tax=Streptomyces chartreusis TaxID=1969 RepID=UPI0036DCD086